MPGANGADAPMASVFALYPGKAFALHNVIELDGRVAHYPTSARGYAPCNNYLLVEDDGALLIDTGFGIHLDSIIAQIESIVPPGVPLSFTTLRVNDFMSVCNGAPLARHFKFKTYYAMQRRAVEVLDFASQTEEEVAAHKASIDLTLITGNDWLYVGESERRPVKFNQSPLRLIGTRWVYDPLCKTLFSSDMFAHSWSDKPEATWVIDSSNDDVTEDDVRRFMLSTRYWWIDGAKTDELRAKVGAIFDEYDIQNIAPSYGKILMGRDVVERHYTMLDEVLRKIDRRYTPPRYIARNEEHYA